MTDIAKRPRIRLRRASDNAERDFYERDRGLDLDEIRAWADGSDLFVKVLYDELAEG
jgi:hypothetical protein